MKKRTGHFSLLEVIIVMVVLVLVLTISMVGFGEKNPGETVIEMSQTLNKVFGNASMRSQSFQVQVNVRMVVEDEKPLKLYLEMVKANPELPTVNPEDMTEEEAMIHSDKNYNIRLWSGEDDYELPADVKLTEYEEIVNEQNEIFFYFYPDGEATGPNLKVMIGDRQFQLSVDRLMGQMVLFENQDI
ncbi:MAG: hypothetical protein NE327_17345 [Lentisphaeraceae bacterium]|nr:hypothetical protein [Lentisphaeraceae bacterium]